MENELEVKNIRCLGLLFLFLLSLFLPIAHNQTASLSLLNLTNGKIVAILLLGSYFICLKNLKRIYLQVFSVTIAHLLLFTIINIGVHAALIINISTISLIIILQILMFYISFK